MTDDRPRINPFQVPAGWPPVRPLCPWQEAEHHDYYVEVDSTERAFQDFTREMAECATLLREGHLALVVGDSGCGKSALVNRCAYWVQNELSGSRTRCEVIDLTTTLAAQPQKSIDDRMSLVCDRLVIELMSRDGLLRTGAQTALISDRTIPGRIYFGLPSALQPDVVLVILLPKPEVAEEMIRYGSLAGGRMLFMAESEMLDAAEVRTIVEALEQRVRPIVLSVGQLRPDDVRTFAYDRLNRHSTKGCYPALTEEAMTRFAKWVQSVRELQQAFHGAYEERLRKGEDYDEKSSVTYLDVLEFQHRWVWNRYGGRP
jgi:energy-coupling factor transporter ATP-binding protein EcfA2